MSVCALLVVVGGRRRLLLLALVVGVGCCWLPVVVVGQSWFSIGCPARAFVVIRLRDFALAVLDSTYAKTRASNKVI